MIRGILTALVTVAAMTSASTAALASGVTGDDAHNTFVIRAGSTAPGSDGEGCAGCATVIAVPVCVDGVQFASPQPGSGCLALDGRCPPDQRFVRQWTAGPAGWIQGDVGCVNLNGAPTVAEIGAAVRDSVIRRVPAVRISTQPGRRALVRVPLLMHSGQPDHGLRWSDVVAGVPVTTSVSATWEWTFGDGSWLQTAQAGSTWPDTSVSHSYTRPGRYPVAVTTRWSGSYVIAGWGPRPIEGSVHQHDSVSVDIHTAGAALEPDLR